MFRILVERLDKTNLASAIPSVGKELNLIRGKWKLYVNYSTIEKELLAILFSVETFRPYLYGKQFTLETGHRPLVWLHNVKNPNSKLIRWRLRLNEYDYVIVYKKGIIIIIPVPFKDLHPERTDQSPPPRNKD